jgi:hypothetical protein
VDRQLPVLRMGDSIPEVGYSICPNSDIMITAWTNRARFLVSIHWHTLTNAGRPLEKLGLSIWGRNTD